MERSLDLNALRTFITAVELGGLSRASRYLEVPKSTVSRHIARLEQQIQATLITRSQAGIGLTSAGQKLFDAGKAGIDSFQNVSRMFAQKDTVTRGLVRIKAPSVFGRGFLTKTIAEFSALYEQVSLQVTLSDRIFDPEDDAVDVSFCVGIPVPAKLASWHLGSLEAKLYAAPSFLKRCNPHSPADLAKCPILTAPVGVGLQRHWTLKGRNTQEHRFAFLPKLETNETDILIAAALEGLGVARLPSFLAQPLCRNGKLVPVLPDWVLDRHDVVLAAKPTLRTAAIDQFIEFCCEHIDLAKVHAL